LRSARISFNDCKDVVPFEKEEEKKEEMEDERDAG
jgi:hypothetical protein